MSAGEKIKEKRKELDISIEQAQKDTKIRKKYLLAIENDDYSQIPGLVYVRAFIKNYSSYLGLDPEEVMEEFERWRHLEGVETEGMSRKKRTHRSRRSKKSPLSFFSASPRILGAIIILLVIFSIVAYNFAFLPGESPGPENGNDVVSEEVEEMIDTGDELEETEEAAEEEPDEEADVVIPDLDGEEFEDLLAEDLTTVDPVAEEVDPVETDIEEAENGDIDEEPEVDPAEEDRTFRVMASGESWVRVTVDGEVLYEAIMIDGDVEEFEPEENLILRTGNAPAITIEYDDQQRNMGGSGAVIEEEFTF